MEHTGSASCWANIRKRPASIAERGRLHPAGQSQISPLPSPESPLARSASDVGWVRWEGGEAVVGPCAMGPISPDGALFVDLAIPVKRGAEGWAFVVVHPLAGAFDLAAGMVELRVDAEARHALNLGHSACHPGGPGPEPDVDALLAQRKSAGGMPWISPTSIALAIQRSGSRPVVRGAMPHRQESAQKRSERRGPAGETGAGRRADQPAAGRLAGRRGRIRRSRAGEAIIDSRYWHCTLDGREVTIPGGTHAASLAELGRVRVQLAPLGRVHPHHPGQPPDPPSPALCCRLA